MLEVLEKQYQIQISIYCIVIIENHEIIDEY